MQHHIIKRVQIMLFHLMPDGQILERDYCIACRGNKHG